MTEQEALQIISDKLDQVRLLIDQCERIAQDGGVAFSFNVGGSGMGGTYIPVPKKKPEKDWDHSACYVEDEDPWRSSTNEDDYGWQSSSSNC